MAKRFTTCSLDQPYLLPPDLRDWLPPNHLAHLVAELDLRPIYAHYERKDGRGKCAYHPLLLTRVLIYAYAVGQPSSRQIEAATYESVPYRYLAANQHPDHDTIASFRPVHLAALADLFVQVLRLCQKAGLVKLGPVALDGTKIKADATKRRSVSYARLSEREQYWHDLVEQLLQQAQQTDTTEAQQALAPPPAPLPPSLADAQTRLAEIRAAKRALEEEAQHKLAEAEAAFPRPGRRGHRPPPGRDPVEHKKLKRAYYRAKQAVAHPKGNYNFTDPDSRIMHDGATQAQVQAYNAQAVVDDQKQIIVAAAVTQDCNDRQQLAVMIARAEVLAGQRPAIVTADTGYWNTADVQALTQKGITVLVPPEADPAELKANSARNVTAEAMRTLLQTDEGWAQYRKRPGTVEPVFGTTKEARGFRQFSLRGRVKVDAAWQLICLGHNVRKLHRYGGASTHAQKRSHAVARCLRSLRVPRGYLRQDFVGIARNRRRLRQAGVVLAQNRLCGTRFSFRQARAMTPAVGWGGR